MCQFYWTSGACDRGFECSFRHVKGNAATDAQTTAAHPDEEDDEGVIDFFSPQGLAASAGSVREDRWLNPSEVHNHLKEFVRASSDEFDSAQVQGFVRLLANVNDLNKTWVRLHCLIQPRWSSLMVHRVQQTGSAQEFLEFVVGVRPPLCDSPLSSHVRSG